jgi:hypothetical protein
MPQKKAAISSRTSFTIYLLALMHKHKHNHRKGLGLCFSASNKPATHPTTDRLVACGEARERDKSQVQE